ncbi:MAG: hypothetical protein L0K63_12490 [Yaniella sp.]|nr:hypothetical protein [Yaniella sp.]
MRRLPGRGGILGISNEDDDDDGGLGDRAGRGGMAGAAWVDMMKFWELLTGQQQPNRIPHEYAWLCAG